MHLLWSAFYVSGLLLHIGVLGLLITGHCGSSWYPWYYPSPQCYQSHWYGLVGLLGIGLMCLALTFAEWCLNFGSSGLLCPFPTSSASASMACCAEHHLWYWHVSSVSFISALLAALVSSASGLCIHHGNGVFAIGKENM